MKKIIALATVVALFVSSCAKNEISQNVSEGNKISFSTYTGIATKGQVYTSEDLEDGFGVIAYNTGAGTSFDTENSVINFMYDTKVYKSGDWTYSPTKYWSSDASTQYSFFGYAPYAGDGITLCDNTAEGTPYLDFTIADDAVDMVDFTASQVMNTTKEDSSDAVQMYFKHQLTRVTFKAKSCVDEETPGYEDIYVNVTGFRILGSAPTDSVSGESYNSVFSSSALYSAATYTFNATTTTDEDEEEHGQDGTWTYYADSLVTDSYYLSSIFADASVYSTIGAVADSGYEEYYTNENGVLLAGGAEAVSLFDEDEYLFLIPPYGADGLDTDNNIQIEVVYDIITKDASLACGFVVSSENNIAIVDLTEETLKQGHAYEYLLTITGASFSDPTDPDIDPDDPDEEAFDAIVITGSVCDWDTSEELGYEAEDTGWDISLGNE